MIMLLIEIWEVIVAFWNTGLRVGGYGLNAARWAIRTCLLAILIWPFVMLAVAYVGWTTWLTATTAMVPLVVFVILLLMFPLISGALVAIPRARIVYRYLLLVVFAEMVIGLYLTVVPVWNRPELIGLLMIVGSTLGIFLILRRMFGWQNRWATRFAGVLTFGIAVITLLFFFGGKKEAKEEKVVQPVQASRPAPSLDSVKEIVRIPLLGEGVPSEQAFVLPGAIPPLWYYYFDGPSTAKVHYDDGTIGPITRWYGMKGGLLKFSGPKGQVVVVRAYPPPS